MNGKNEAKNIDISSKNEFKLKKPHRHLGIDEEAGATVKLNPKQEEKLKKEGKI